MSKTREKSANEILRILEGLKSKKEEGGISTLPKARPTKDQKEALKMMATDEFRAELDPYFQSNPLAELGFKLFEQGKLKLLPVPVGLPDGSKKPRYVSDRGRFVDAEKPDARVSMEGDDFFYPLQDFNMDAPKPGEAGLAAYAVARDIMPERRQKMTIAHEFTHAGLKHLLDNISSMKKEDGQFVLNTLKFPNYNIGGKRYLGDPSMSPGEAKARFGENAFKQMNRGNIKQEERIVDAMENITYKESPQTQITERDVLERLNIFFPDSKPELEKKRAKEIFAKQQKTQLKKPFGYDREVEKLNELANEQLRKMNVPEKKGQLGFFDKVQRYFEGVF